MQRIGLELETLRGQVSNMQDVITSICSTQTEFGVPEDSDYIPTYASNVRHIKSLLDESVRTFLERRNTVLNKGLSKIPDEILSLIFTLVCSPSTKVSGVDCAVAISHVCRRFRRVALGTVQLWSRLFSADSRLKSSAFLSRTKSAGLTVVVNDIYPLNDAHIEAFFALVKPHCERWLEFRYSPHEGSQPLSSLHVLKKLSSGLHLPRLRRLHIFSGPNEARDTLPNQDSMVCSDWVVPELRELTCWNGHPDLRTFKDISSLTVVLTCHNLYGTSLCLSALLESLADLPLLQTLELLTALSSITKKPIAITELPSLRTLHICVLELAYSGPLRSFYSALRLPSLSTLLLAVGPLKDPADFQTLFECIAFKPMQCPSLKVLHVKRKGKFHDRGIRPSFTLDSIFQSFPSVHHLSVDLDDFKALCVGTGVPAYLLTLSLVCYEIRGSQLEGLIDGIKAAPGYADFKKLRISPNKQDARPLRTTRNALGEKLCIETQPIRPPCWAEDFLSRL